MNKVTNQKQTVVYTESTEIPVYAFSYRDRVGHLSPDFRSEMKRISQLVGQPKEHLRATLEGDSNESHIVYWGSIDLLPLSADDVVKYISRELKKGYLVDYSLSIPYSARMDFPIFSVSGGSGVVLNFRIDNDGTERMAVRVISPGAFVR